MTPYIKLEPPIKTLCPNCAAERIVVSSFFSKNEDHEEEEVYFCSECNSKIRYIVKYSGEKAALPVTELLNVKRHEISINCLDCNNTFSATYDWYDYDSQTGENWHDEICNSCGTFIHVKFQWDSKSIKIIETDIKKKWPWEEYYSNLYEREDCFFLTGSEVETLGDDYIGFLKRLETIHGKANEDAGGVGGIGGSDKWEEYCPFLDGGYVRLQGNWEDPEYSDGLALEGIWIFGINAFRYVCYVENLTQPELYDNELSIPSYSDVCKIMSQKKVIKAPRKH